MSSDPTDRGDLQKPQPQAEPPQPVSPSDETPEEGANRRKRILIGSQRDPIAYRPKPKRDWIPTTPRDQKPESPQAKPESPQIKPGPERTHADAVPSTPVVPSTVPSVAPESAVALSVAPPAVIAQDQPAGSSATSPLGAAQPAGTVPSQPDRETVQTSASRESDAPAEPQGRQPDRDTVSALPAGPVMASAPPAGAPAGTVIPQEPRRSAGREDRGGPNRGPRGGRDRRGAERKEKKAEPIEVAPRNFPPPNIRDRLSPDLQAELEEAMADVSMEEMLAGGEAVTAQVVLEPETRQSGRVVTITREDVFVELGGREQGIIPLRLFTAEPPQPGAELDVIVVRYNPEDGLYELTLPNVAASVGDWSQISEGMLVEARVTGHNAGGLECEVNRIRGFIPISQIALYRVENLEEFLEQRFLCLVSEADPQRRNLILSRRAVLEREKEEARQKMFESLAPGQIYEGLVRKIMDFGAFVELDGGVDGLLHISQLGWGRVKHPSDVVQEGQRIRVRVDRVDAETGRIGLSYRDLLENPWDTADRKYLPNTPYHGRVMKIMEFGAFVELEPGVEGLVHISELSHKRVARVSDVVKEGEEIDVMVLSVDMDAKRISLSMKAVQPLPEPEMKAEAAPAAKPAEPPLPPPKPKKPAGPLKGGLGRSPEAERFGLKW